MKRVFSILIFFVIVQFTYSIEFKIPHQFVQTDFNCVANKGIEHNNFVFSAEYGAEWDCINAVSGFQIYSDVLDFSLSADFFPKKLQFDLDSRSIALGFGGIYHFQNQFDIASENDFSFLSYFKIFTNHGFEFKALLGYGFKITNIYALPSEFGVLFDHNVMAGFFISQKIGKSWEVYCSCKNFDLYRYYLIDNPLHTFGGSYEIGKFKFFGEIELKFTDQIKSTPCMTGVWFRLSGRYYFK